MTSFAGDVNKDRSGCFNVLLYLARLRLYLPVREQLRSDVTACPVPISRPASL